MDIRKLSLTPRAIATFAMTVALTFSCVVEAVSIGEVVLQSRLGEPLLAQVDLMVGSGEQIEDSCLSLAAPDPHEEDTSGYLTKANLSFKNDGKRQYVTISSRKPFNDAFARLRLQVNCPGTSNVIKTLTILPDLDASVPQAPITAPSAPAEAANTSPRAPSEAHDIAPAANQRASGNAQPDVEKYLAHKAARPTNKRHSSSARTASTKRGRSASLSAQTTSEKQDRSVSFRLKLSGDTLDESRIGKISAEERALLLARQKLLDADDQMASFLAMQHQVKQLQDELGEIKLQLTQLGVRPATAASSAAAAALAPSATPQMSPTTGTSTGTQGSSPKPAIAVKQPVVQQNDLPSGLFAALGLVLAILALWLGLRYYTKTKSHTGIKSHPDAEPVLQPEDNLSAALKMAISPVVKPSTQEKIVPAPVVAPPIASTARNEAPPPAPQKIEAAEVTEDDSMLEEAGLYASHGRPAKAAEILQEIIKRNPSKADAWTLLLSIHSSLAKASEFEKTAREFLKQHPDSPSWRGIQALGRTFDQNNPLYTENNGRISAAPLFPGTATPIRQVGDILIEMGVLSNQDIQSCLDDFDPKKHGRFGGYLVSRKAITLAQLDQALLQQQGVYNETKPGSMPSLQEMENFLADFDPKRDGSIGEFLASRNITPEQLSQLLRQQSSQGTAAETPQAGVPPPLK
jgi:pilus assembly protein FimV